MKKCRVCGKPISSYNNTGQCYHHSLPSDHLPVLDHDSVCSGSPVPPLHEDATGKRGWDYFFGDSDAIEDITDAMERIVEEWNRYA